LIFFLLKYLKILKKILISRKKINIFLIFKRKPLKTQKKNILILDAMVPTAVIINAYHIDKF
jgi:predicted regulator of amino acid metabolism with ACT domain